MYFNEFTSHNLLIKIFNHKLINLNSKNLNKRIIYTFC